MMIIHTRGKSGIVKDCGYKVIISSCLSEGQDIIYSEAVLDPSGDVAGYQAAGLSEAGDLQTVAL